MGQAKPNINTMKYYAVCTDTHLHLIRYNSTNNCPNDLKFSHFA